MAQCTATTADGKRCRAPALQGRPFCFAHDPEKAEERADARRRGGYNRRTPKATDPDGYPTRLRSVGDVQAVLERAPPTPGRRRTAEHGRRPLCGWPTVR